MPYSVKVVIIIAVVAVVSFFVAELVIPERSAVAASGSAVEEQPSEAGGDIPQDEALPVTVAAPQPNQAADVKTAKNQPIDAKASKTADVKVGKAEPADAKAAKAVDTKTAAALPQKTAAPAVQPVPAAQPAAAEKPPAQKKTGSSYRLEKAVLCSAIKDREPQGVANKFSKDAPFVYYFTHVVGARDSTTVIHRWYQNGKLVQTSNLPVKSNYWRTHSKRNLQTHAEKEGDVTGQWRVDIIDVGNNTVMESASFTIE